MCIVSLDRNKTVFHEVHIELRVTRSAGQLMFVLGDETEQLLSWSEVRSGIHGDAPWVISEGLCPMGYMIPVPLRNSKA
jgi:hypothetical protein